MYILSVKAQKYLVLGFFRQLLCTCTGQLYLWQCLNVSFVEKFTFNYSKWNLINASNLGFCKRANSIHSYFQIVSKEVLERGTGMVHKIDEEREQQTRRRFDQTFYHFGEVIMSRFYKMSTFNWLWLFLDCLRRLKKSVLRVFAKSSYSIWAWYTLIIPLWSEL